MATVQHQGHIHNGQAKIREFLHLRGVNLFAWSAHLPPPHPRPQT